MKRVITMLLAITMVLAFCSCGTDEETEQESQELVVNLPDNSRKTPSKEMVMEDISRELLAKNQYALVTAIETIKSLTDEGSYKISLNISAETKYADCTYIADLLYTEYDQGWMLDDVVWNDESYVQVRMPDRETMAEYATEYLSNHAVYSDVSFSEYLVPMFDFSMDSYTDSRTNSNVIRLRWNGKEQLRHAVQIHDCESLWEYEFEIDNWVLKPNEDQGSLGYCVDWNWGGTVVPDTSLDYSGEWHADRLSHVVTLGYFTSIVISDFSWEGFSAEIPGFRDRVSREWDSSFKRIDEDWVVFENKLGDRISFAFGEDWTEISLVLSGENIAVAEGRIAEDLPELPKG